MIWCLRWCCSHVVSLWLSMMWVCWLILGNLWDLLFQWVLFWESLFSVVWCHILILHWLPFCLLVFICGRLTLLCHFKNDFPISGTGVKVCCTFIWSIPVHPYWLGLCIQKNMYFCNGFGLPLVPLRLFPFVILLFMSLPLSKIHLIFFHWKRHKQ